QHDADEPRGLRKEMPMRWKMIVPTATLTMVPFTLSIPTAQAFFPPISPPPPIGVVTPPVSPPPIIVVPPSPPVNPPVSPPPIVVPPSPQPPSSTAPEPSSLIAGISGLAAAAGWAARRRKK
ncbi:MAG TPA: PEP-CTERM sorting domain-containing protein, partial [Gemmataceae bacterium]